MKIFKSPLRYPGGKSRAIPQIMARLPVAYNELREPFVGGGSVFIHIRQVRPHVKVWINDLNFDLYCFWKEAQKDVDRLAAAVLQIKETELDGKALFERMREVNPPATSDFARAVRFFVMNRISFSGTVDSGGYSQQAFHSRFTLSSIDRLMPLKQILDGVKITNLDYKETLNGTGNETLIFLDPPYLVATKSKLYGKNGDLHTGFNHCEFAKEMSECPHKWLITYDDSLEIRENFHFSHIHEWELQYGMNNYKQGKAEIGHELFLCNFISASSPVLPAALNFGI